MVTVLVLAGTAGCATHGLAFRHDDRVDVIAPDDRSKVTLPLTVRWTGEDLPAGAAYAVSVDVAPPRPGRRPGEDDQVVITDETQVVLDRLGTTSRAGGSGFHRITVFLVDGDGARLGESAWPVDVRLGDSR